MSSGVSIQSGRSEAPKPGGDGMINSWLRARSVRAGASSSSASSPWSTSSGAPRPRRSTSSSSPPTRRRLVVLSERARIVIVLELSRAKSGKTTLIYRAIFPLCRGNVREESVDRSFQLARLHGERLRRFENVGRGTIRLPDGVRHGGHAAGQLPGAACRLLDIARDLLRGGALFLDRRGDADGKFADISHDVADRANGADGLGHG